MPVTSNDVANEAIQLIGDNQPAVTGNAPNFDNSATGKILAKVYAPVVAAVQRQWKWDAARNTVALQASGNVAPFPWAVEYLYPPNGIQVWQLVDPQQQKLDPRPINWAVANTQVAQVQTKVIQTDLSGALAVYNNNPNESTWDPLFRQAVVRLLASVLAMAAAGKPDAMQAMIESGGAMEQLAEQAGD